MVPSSAPSCSARSLPTVILKLCRAASVSSSRSTSQHTAVRAIRPSSSRVPATARWRSGSRKTAASTSAPASVTDSGTTSRAASASAMAPASPDRPTEPPAATSTVAATTDGNAPPGRSAAPAAHRPSAATTIMVTMPATAAPRACAQARTAGGAPWGRTGPGEPSDAGPRIWLNLSPAGRGTAYPRSAWKDIMRRHATEFWPSVTAAAKHPFLCIYRRHGMHAPP